MLCLKVDAMALPGEGEVTLFNSLGISQWLADICRSLGMKSATPVQKGCIPAILEVKSIALHMSNPTSFFGVSKLAGIATIPQVLSACMMLNLPVRLFRGSSRFT